MTLVSTRLTAFPLPAHVDDYRRAASELEGRLRELPGLMALYQTGSVTAPGISDIDRVAVTAHGTSLPPLWKRLHPRTRYLAMHSPFAVDIETFARHDVFASLEPLELVTGRDVPREDIPASDESDLVLGTEGLVVALLKLVKQETTGRTKVRPMLCELNNVKRDLQLVRVQPGDAPASWQLAADVTRARDEWWSWNEVERVDAIRSIQATAVEAIQEALRAVAVRLALNEAAFELRLCGPWSNVTIRVNPPRSGHKYLPLPRSVASRSAKLAEARWRSRSHSVPVPPQIIAILDGSLVSPIFRQLRRAVLHRYRSFLAEMAPDYAALGHAQIFPL